MYVYFQVNFTRLGELFKSLRNPPKRTALEKKTVSFPDSKPCENNTSDAGEHEPPREHVVQFVWPAVCSICAKNIAEVCLSAAEDHSSLLLTLLQTYGSNKSLLKSVNSFLEANHPSLLLPSKSPRGEDHQLLALCVTLSKSMTSEGLLLDSLVTENIAECVIILLYSGLVDEESAHMFLSELVKVRSVCVCVRACVWCVCVHVVSNSDLLSFWMVEGVRD